MFRLDCPSVSAADPRRIVYHLFNAITPLHKFKCAWGRYRILKFKASNNNRRHVTINPEHLLAMWQPARQIPVFATNLSILCTSGSRIRLRDQPDPPLWLLFVGCVFLLILIWSSKHKPCRKGIANFLNSGVHRHSVAGFRITSKEAGYGSLRSRSGHSFINGIVGAEHSESRVVGGACMKI